MASTKHLYFIGLIAIFLQLPRKSNETPGVPWPATASWPRKIQLKCHFYYNISIFFFFFFESFTKNMEILTYDLPNAYWLRTVRLLALSMWIYIFSLNIIEAAWNYFEMLYFFFYSIDRLRFSLWDTNNYRVICFLRCLKKWMTDPIQLSANLSVNNANNISKAIH